MKCPRCRKDLFRGIDGYFCSRCGYRGQPVEKIRPQLTEDIYVSPRVQEERDERWEGQ